MSKKKKKISNKVTDGNNSKKEKKEKDIDENKKPNKKKKIIIIILIILGVAILATVPSLTLLYCSNASQESLHVSSITLNETNKKILEGEEFTLDATINPNTAINKHVNWTSSNSDIASVDNNGKVKGIKEGKTQIIATSEENNKQAFCEIEVYNIYPSNIKIDDGDFELDLTKNQEKQLTYTIKPDEATKREVSWSSSDETVAKVDDKGKVSCVGVGKASITVKSLDKENITSSVSVTVKKGSNGVKIDNKEVELNINDVNSYYKELTVSSVTEGAQIFDPIWSIVEGNDIVSLSSSSFKTTVTALKSGTAKIQVSCKDVFNNLLTDTATIKVSKNAYLNYLTFTVTSSNDLECSVKMTSSTSYPDDKKIEIPNRVYIDGSYYKVTSLDDNAFKNCSSLTNISIPSTITAIGKYAFYKCSSLTSLSLPNNINKINEYTFYGCNKLSNFIIPDSVTSIGDYAFSYCEKLSSISIPNNVLTIGNYAFAYCLNITNLNLITGLTTIGNFCFYNCSSLKNINIPKSVTSIGESSFYMCTSLESISVDSENTVYNSNNDCNAIIKTDDKSLILGCKNTIIPNNVTSIGDYAFDSCNGLTEISIPNNVLSIGKYSFTSCTNLKSVTFENGLISIDEGAFLGCDGLTSIKIPASVTSIGIKFLSNCNELSSIEVDTNNSVFKSENNSIIEISSNKLIAGCKNSIVSTSVTSIAEYAFYYCENLTNIEIPDTVNSIGIAAFFGCINLKSITLPFIGENETSTNCFLGYIFGASTAKEQNSYVPSSLTSVILSDYCSSIPSLAFYGLNNLTSITIGSSIESIPNSCFSTCSKLSEIIINSSTIANLDSNDSSLFTNATVVYVKDGISVGDCYLSSNFSLNSVSSKSGYQQYDKN